MSVFRVFDGFSCIRLFRSQPVHKAGPDIGAASQLLFFVIRTAPVDVLGPTLL